MRNQNVRLTVHTMIGLLAAFPLAATSADNLVCRPSSKHHCDADGCARETEGFQHAEVFYYHHEAKVLTACLWTNCYSDTVSVFVAPDKTQTSLVGWLPPDHSPDMYPPMLITMTIDSEHRFTASWQHQGNGITLDHGICKNQ